MENKYPLTPIVMLTAIIGDTSEIQYLPDGEMQYRTVHVRLSAAQLAQLNLESSGEYIKQSFLDPTSPEPSGKDTGKCLNCQTRDSCDDNVDDTSILFCAEYEPEPEKSDE